MDYSQNQAEKSINASSKTVTGRWWVSFVVTVLVAALIFAFIELDDFDRLLAELGWSGLLTSALLYTLTLLSRTWRFMIVLGLTGVSVALRLLPTVVQHQFFNHVIPARRGELSFPILLRQRQGVRIAEGTAALLFVRVYDVLALLAIGLAAVVLLAFRSEIGPIANPTGIVGLLLVVIVTISSVVWTVAFFHRGEPVRVPAVIARRWPEFEGRVAQLQSSICKVWSSGRHLAVLGVTLLNWLLLIVFFHAFLVAGGIAVHPLDTLIGSTLANVAQLLPINSFGSLGSLEAGWVTGFYLVGVDAETALASGVVMHVLVLTILGVGTLMAQWSRFLFKDTTAEMSQ